MIKSTKRGLLFALLAIFGLMGTVAQVYDHSSLAKPNTSLKAPLLTPSPASVVHNRAWYEQEQFDYTWTDADGISHTSKFTDIATDPYQIVALLQMVYCNPNIPGIKYSSFTGYPVYYGPIGNGWDISEVTPPTEEGYTLLIVSMKYNNNNAPFEVYSRDELIDYLQNYVESIQLLTDGMRIGSDDNEGTVFNMSGTYNRFFFISKGKLYDYGSGVAPFDLMFEEFSPTSPSGGETTDFYAKMVAGETYPINHDCPSVIYYTHYFSMAGKSGTEPKSMTGLNVFITDNRNELYGYTYTIGYQPLVGIYTVDLSAQRTINDENTCDVTLNWTSSLDKMAKEAVAQTYTVYVVLTDEFGNDSYQKLEVTPNPTGATTLTYTVPRNENSYTINYIISGTPSDENYSNFFTWSNTASVVIPGMDVNETINLYINHYESDYKDDVNRNYYRNMFNMNNDNTAYGITPAMITAGHNKIDIYRYANGNYNLGTVAGHISLSLNGSSVYYTVTYENQDILNGYQLSNLGIATSGSLGSYANNAFINMNPIVICDQFSAEINDNISLPNRYEYILREDNVNDPIYSNSVVVPVFKTTATIDGYYTHEEVMNDVDALLTANVLNTNVEMQISNNPSIYYYTLCRGINSAPEETISKLQHRTDGSYLEMLDVLPNYNDEIINMGTDATKIIDRHDINIVTGVSGDYMSYQPVLWTFGNDRILNDGANSYGSPILKTGIGEIFATLSNSNASQYGNWLDENGNNCTVYNPTISITGVLPELNDAEYEPFMYRVWALCDYMRGYTIDDLTGEYINDPTADRSSKQLIAERLTNETSILLGENNELSFGAILDSTIKFIIRFYYVKKGESTSAKPMFYVIDKTISWDNNSSGIKEIGSNEVISETYYNAVGIPSPVPYNGINIVVTRYNDGSTKTSKIAR